MLSLGTPCELNKLDTFKFLFPEDEEFLEINYCADTMQSLHNILNKLKEAR